MKATLALAMTVLVGGCFPYVVPPMTSSVGPSYSSAVRDGSGVHLDLGLSPWQFAETQLHRPWDGSVSASYDSADGGAWGAAIAGGPILHPWGDGDADDTTTRLIPEAIGRWTTAGKAAGFRVTLEYASFTSGSKDDEDGNRLQHGEVSIGIYAELDRDWADGDRDGFTATAGLRVRLPVISGLLWY